MGENSRYERYAHHVDAETEAEASALRVVAGLVERGVPPIPDRVCRRFVKPDPARVWRALVNVATLAGQAEVSSAVNSSAGV